MRDSISNSTCFYTFYMAQQSFNVFRGCNELFMVRQASSMKLVK